ncbi:MAG: GNAT family N-acetyltransferase [Candidatus Heimdallarchaeota archaeon]
MLQLFPKERFMELEQLLAKHEHLQIMIRSILKEKNADIYVDNLEKPSIALVCFKVIEIITGDHNHPLALELLTCLSENKMLLFQDEDWHKFAEQHMVLSPFPRTKFSSEKLSIEKANELLEKELPKGYSLHKIDLATLQTLNPRLLPVILPFYKSFEDFIERGIGYCVKKDNFVVSLGISGFPIYDNEFEFQVLTDPKPRNRRKGLATACCAATIKESLERGITPHWDADHEISAKLALKLGFSKPENYSAYICSRNPLHCKYKR